MHRAELYCTTLTATATTEHRKETRNRHSLYGVYTIQSLLEIVSQKSTPIDILVFLLFCYSPLLLMWIQCKCMCQRLTIFGSYKKKLDNSFLLRSIKKRHYSNILQTKTTKHWTLESCKHCQRQTWKIIWELHRKFKLLKYRRQNTKKKSCNTREFNQILRSIRLYSCILDYISHRKKIKQK